MGRCHTRRVMAFGAEPSLRAGTSLVAAYRCELLDDGAIRRLSLGPLAFASPLAWDSNPLVGRITQRQRYIRPLRE